MADDKDYSNEPVSINELKSQKFYDGKLWTPRDALVTLLRQIDQGIIQPNICFIAYQESFDDGGVKTSFSAAGGSTSQVMGVAELAKSIMLDNFHKERKR